MKMSERIDQAFKVISKTNSKRVIIETNLRQYTYALLDHWSDVIAYQMRQITSENIIALCMEKSVEYTVAVLAALKANLTYLPIDPKYPTSRIQYMLEDCRCHTVFTSVAKDAFNMNALNCIPFNTLNQDGEINPLFFSKANPIACIIYTSGSTGQPKPVMVSHKGILNLIANQLSYFNLGTNDRLLQFSSISFDASIPELWIPLLAGATQVIPQDSYLSGEFLANLIIEKQISAIIIPPSILDTIPDPISITPPLKTVISAGEALTRPILEKWSGNLQTFINAYGPSEATVCATYFLYNQPTQLDNIIGKPLDGVDVCMLDDALQPLEPGKVGELYIGGVGISPGYYNHPELDKERFIQNPFKHGEKLYKTGDLAKQLPCKNIQYIGRIDRQVKINGIRIELEEIENQLVQHPEINAATVYLETNPDNGEKKLVAYFSVRSHGEISHSHLIHSLRSYMLKKLPANIVPHHYILVKEFPRLPNGKIDKSKPVDLALHVQIAPEAPIIANASSGVERELIETYAKVLQIGSNAITPKSDFFDLGGTSLSAIRLISEIKKKFLLDLPIDVFFMRSSVHDLLTLMNAKQADLESQEIMNDVSSLDDDLFFDLDSLIKSQKPTNAIHSIKDILLTGATGFLGAYLLHSLLQNTRNTTLHCIVRINSGQSPLQKIQDVLQKYGLAVNQDDFPRIKAYAADLAKCDLGLAKEDYNFLTKHVDTIYHCAATVNHLYPYEMLRKVNVLGTIELLKFAMSIKKKSIHYISALDVTLLKYKQHTFAEEKNQVQSKMGYIQTKWVSEYLLEKAATMFDLQIRVYRPGNIIGDLEHGIMEPSTNHFLMFTKGCIQMGYGPNTDFAIEMTPVDIVANSIVNLSLQNSREQFTVYDLHNPSIIFWKEYVQILKDHGFSISLVENTEWINNFLINMDEKNALFLLKQHYLNNTIPLSAGIEQLPYPKAAELLATLCISYPNDYQFVGKKHLKQLERVGFL